MGTRFSAPVQTDPGAQPSSCTMGTGFFPEVNCSRSVKLIPQLLLVPWSRKFRAIPLLSLWAVRPVQSLSACTRVTFTFTFNLIKNLWNSNSLEPIALEMVKKFAVSFGTRRFITASSEVCCCTKTLGDSTLYTLHPPNLWLGTPI